VEGELVESPNDVINLIPEASLVWWNHDSLIAEQITVIKAQADLKQLRAAYRRGEIEVRRDGMLWQDERVTPSSRWEIVTNDEFDPARLETEGKTLPLPPPTLGIRYFFWKFAPRAVPINKDPLRWLKLSADEWQVSGNQIVPKGMGGYGSDDEDDDDAWDSQPRFPDQPTFGPRDLWDKAKFWVTRIVARENPEMSDRQLLQHTVNLVKQNGWQWLACLFLDNVPDEIEKRLADGIPMSPNWRSIRDSLVAQQTNMSRKKAKSVVHRSIVIRGWATYVGWYRNAISGEEYQELVVHDFLDREQYAFPRKTPEQLENYLEQHWADVRTLYEQRRIETEWKNFQKQKIAEQKAQAKARGEEYEWDIDDDQGVGALTRQWVQEILAPEPEDSEEETVETLDESVEQITETEQNAEEESSEDQQPAEGMNDMLEENEQECELEENSV
jgi:hypothetical protein